MVLVQLVTPLTFAIDQVPVALGETAPTGPVTVAVKEIEVPSTPLELSAATVTVGVTLSTAVVWPDVGDIER